MADGNAEAKIKELHFEILEAQKKKRDISKVLRDAFLNHKEYVDLKTELNKLNLRRKEIEAVIKREYSSEVNELENLVTDIKDTKMTLSDMIWNEIMKNNSVEVIDDNNNHYVPNIVVTLKKE